MNIPCETKGCNCPSARKGANIYTFKYINNDQDFIYYDVPKAGSTTIRTTWFEDAWPARKGPCKYSVLEPYNDKKQYFTFTFVRNPFDRMVSTWKHFISKPYHIQQLKSSGADIAKCQSFEGFLEMCDGHQNHHWQPQHVFIPDDVNFIGKIESFEEDFNFVCKQIGSDKRLTHTNATDRKPYTEYYTDHTKQIVAKRYSQDLKRFNYEY